MKQYVCLLVGVAFLAGACHKKETTVTNPEESKAETNTAIVDEAANTPVTNLPLDKKTDTKAVSPSPTPTPLSEATLPMESNTPIASESPDASSDTGTNPPAGNTTGGNTAVFGGSSSSSSNTASPEFTVNPAREALRRQIMQGPLPSATP